VRKASSSTNETKPTTTARDRPVCVAEFLIRQHDQENQMPNVADLLRRSASERADRVAIKLDETELSYAELDEAANRVAGLLRAKGVQPGERVGIMLPNVTYFPICYYGVLRAGGAVVPMNVLLKEREVAFYLSDSGAKVLLAWHQFAEAAHAGAEQTDAECVLVEPGEFETLLQRCRGRAPHTDPAV
jgi:long-chain acyl-CoA synthetase